MAQMTFGEFAEQVVALYTQGKYEEAVQLLEQYKDSFPEEMARVTFWRMCLLSLAGRPAEVMPVFRKGLDSGLWWHNSVLADDDLNNVRDLSEFQELAAESQKKYEAALAHMDREYSALVPEPPASGSYPLLIFLHGRNSNKNVQLPLWEAARQRGWLVVAAQSTQPLFPGAYCWDDPAQGLADVLYYQEKISQEYPIDSQRVILAGFSQGGGMSIYSALSGKLNVRGFVGIASFWAEPPSLPKPQGEAKNIRGYFITGEKDHTLDNAREIHRVLQEQGIAFGEEVHAELAHEFPSDFEKSFEQAIDFIFKEHE